MKSKFLNAKKTGTSAKGNWLPKQVFQFKITLKHLTPKVWRRFLVTDEITFRRLHLIIQDVMGWENGHLYSFTTKTLKIEEKHDVGNIFDELSFFRGIVTYESKKVQINQVFIEPKSKMLYTYDFGDDWEHDIVLEKILDLDPAIKYPICLAGKNNCPPEDCGGVPGYLDMMEISSNNEHPNHEEVMEWLGNDYNQAYFSAEEVSALLKRHIGKNI